MRISAETILSCLGTFEGFLFGQSQFGVDLWRISLTSLDVDEENPVSGELMCLTNVEYKSKKLWEIIIS